MYVHHRTITNEVPCMQLPYTGPRGHSGKHHRIQPQQLGAHPNVPDRPDIPGMHSAAGLRKRTIDIELALVATAGVPAIPRCCEQIHN